MNTALGSEISSAVLGFGLYKRDEKALQRSINDLQVKQRQEFYKATNAIKHLLRNDLPESDFRDDFLHTMPDVKIEYVYDMSQTYIDYLTYSIFNILCSVDLKVKTVMYLPASYKEAATFATIHFDSLNKLRTLFDIGIIPIFVEKKPALEFSKH